MRPCFSQVTSIPDSRNILWQVGGTQAYIQNAGEEAVSESKSLSLKRFNTVSPSGN